MSVRFPYKTVLVGLNVQIEGDVWSDGRVENLHAYFTRGLPIEDPKTFKPIPWENLLGLYAAEHDLHYDEAEPAITSLLWELVQPYAAKLWESES